MKQVTYPCGCVLTASLDRYAIVLEMEPLCSTHATEVEKVAREAYATT